ncbi:MAG: transcription-repair coupling factor [Candidatus Zixiibacteriota bacterium]|nr:MAG: transcription-repair coupling factor [candidate division Zixibacteria bacterium]
MSIATEYKRGYLDSINERFRESIPFRELLDRIENGADEELTISGLAGSSPAMLIAGLGAEIARPIIVITSSPEEADDLYDDLMFLMDEESINHFPSLQAPPYEFRAPSAETIGRRLSAISALKRNKAGIVVAPIAAILEPTISPGDYETGSLVLQVGDEADIYSLSDKLVGMGFNRVNLVEEIGDFAVRGGLIDFFSPGFEHPVRVEFFGDEVETIRQFDVATQRTTKKLEKVELLPRREVSIRQETIEDYIEKMPEDDGDLVRARYLNDPELPGLEWLATSFGMDRGCLLDFISTDPIFFLKGAGSIKVEIEEIFKDARKRYTRIKDRMEKPPDVEKYYSNLKKYEDYLVNGRKIDLVPFKGGRDNIIDFECREHPALGSRLDMISSTVEGFYRGGIRFFIAADNPGQASRLQELLGEKINSPAVLPIEVAQLKGGFVSKTYKFAVLTDHQIFGRHYRRARRKKFKEGVAIQNYTSLTKGDYVVHTNFGIARYQGLQTIEVGGRPRDCLLLIYADGDKLYVPIEEFNYVSKYSGKDSAPRLSSLGGTGWEKIKARTKKAIADMAADLLKIYAARKARPGFAFGPDTTWMRQLEATFPYEETTDQLKAINNVKADMERPIPTDRLVCGDVGYGKTEVAIRAAFKAVEGGKQVAVLVPTTILAQQHHSTFTRRLADFPVRIEVLSRFRTRKEQKATVAEIAEGKVDIVIGTHRLLSKDVEFHDLGLLIIDEEQRFGVRHKERLRKIKSTVDTIALTATPIPRTLQMSLMGARDMSLINTSPKDRLPILTTISEFDPEVIAEVILQEIDRGGQVFFVHNRVQTIEAMYRYLKKIVPQAEIAVAHGQMHEKSLEGIMLAFLAKKFQVLLSTSIIESGLDIPSVNTIIINRADRFGLAQLYQLRGRVGRSAVHARAYLLTPAYRLISEDARKRLRAIEAHADLGSGFALAMKDLEIRGAGNILGAQQSGFIEEIGFDLYTKLLEEAVAELKGETVPKMPDTKIEMDIEILIPDYYMDIKQQKVEVYQKIAGSRTLDEIENIRDNVEDRFGKAPDEVNNLFEAAAVKISAFAHQIEKVRIRSGMIEFHFNADKKFERKEVESWRRASEYPMEFSYADSMVIRLDLSQVGRNKRLQYIRSMLNRI